ncbi:hypothetical protein HMPREF1503_1994 [Olsenella uli MSTE5]|nr:hypothetical protein HMPREF1503_1994 [Olsenella uli MSTE5]
MTRHAASIVGGFGTQGRMGANPARVGAIMAHVACWIHWKEVACA